jgi:hypothetical protein
MRSWSLRRRVLTPIFCTIIMSNVVLDFMSLIAAHVV